MTQSGHWPGAELEIDAGLRQQPYRAQIESDGHRAGNRERGPELYAASEECWQLTTFVMSYALARGMIGAGLTVTAAMALGMIATIGGIALAATFARDRFMSLLAKTEAWRGRAGFVLEIGSSILVVAFGAWTLISAISR